MFSFSGVLNDGLELLVMVPQDVYDELEELDDDNNDEEILRRVQGATKLIFDETAKVLLCATNFKSRIAGVSLLSGGPAIGIYLSYPEGATRIDSSSSNNVRWVKYSVTKNDVTKEYTLSEDDLLTIEFDWGDAIKDHIPTDYAKQGTNPNATLSAILEALQGSGTPSPDIPEGVAERLAMILEHFGIKTISGYEFMTDTEVTDELEDIMQALDPELEQEVEYPEGSGTYMTKAQAITAEAMQIINPSQS